MPTTSPVEAAPIVIPHKVTTTFALAATFPDVVRVNCVLDKTLEVALSKPPEVLVTLGAAASIKKLVGKITVTMAPELRALCKLNARTTFRFVVDATRSAAKMVITTLDTWPPRMPADAEVPLTSVEVVIQTSFVPWLGW